MEVEKQMFGKHLTMRHREEFEQKGLAGSSLYITQ